MKNIYLILAVFCVGICLADELPNPRMDIAHIRFASTIGNAKFFSKRSDCYKCPFDVIRDDVDEHFSDYSDIWMQIPYEMYAEIDGNKTELFQYTFDEYGVYSLTLQSVDQPYHQVAEREGHDYNDSAYILFGCFFAIILLIILIENFYEPLKKYIVGLTKKSIDPTTPIISTQTEEETVKETQLDTVPLLEKKEDALSPVENMNGVVLAMKNKTRVASIDVFRGFALCMMILANYGGGGYHWFEHASWNGVEFADMAFPWFMYIMGASLRLSIPSCYNKYMKKHNVFVSILLSLVKIVRRTCILLLLNWLNNGFTKWETLRITGVLFYFSISYCINAIVILLTHALFTKLNKYQQFSIIIEVIPIIICAISYLCLQAYYPPLEGCPIGYFGVGGRGDDGLYEKCTGGAHRSIDYALFGGPHLYRYPTCKDLYGCNDVDPEGILGTLNAIVLTYMGTIITYILKAFKTSSNATKNITISFASLCVFFTFIAFCLTGFHRDGGLIPMNKTLWSTSFVFYLGGLGYGVFLILYLMIDVYHIWSGTPIKAVGMNSIFIYMTHEFVVGKVPFGYDFSIHSHFYRLLSQFVMGVGMWIIFANIMAYQKIFFKV